MNQYISVELGLHTASALCSALLGNWLATTVFEKTGENIFCHGIDKHFVTFVDNRWEWDHHEINDVMTHFNNTWDLVLRRIKQCVVRPGLILVD